MSHPCPSIIFPPCTCRKDACTSAQGTQQQPYYNGGNAQIVTQSFYLIISGQDCSSSLTRITVASMKINRILTHIHEEIVKMRHKQIQFLVSHIEQPNLLRQTGTNMIKY